MYIRRLTKFSNLEMKKTRTGLQSLLQVSQNTSGRVYLVAIRRRRVPSSAFQKVIVSPHSTES